MKTILGRIDFLPENNFIVSSRFCFIQGGAKLCLLITNLPSCVIYKMEIQKVFSNIEDPGETLYSVLMSEDEVVLFSEIQKEFGFKSKALAVMAPGAYQAKEAAKYAYDDDEYKKKRGGYALKGAFSPGTATYVKKKAQKMAEEGKSKAEIREYLENSSDKRVAAGVAEAITGGFGGVTSSVAQGVGLYDKITGHRAKTGKKEK